MAVMTEFLRSAAEAVRPCIGPALRLLTTRRNSLFGLCCCAVQCWFSATSARGIGRSRSGKRLAIVAYPAQNRPPNRGCSLTQLVPLSGHKSRLPGRRVLTGLLTAAFSFAALGQTNPYFDPSKRHHTPEGFQNNYIGTVNKSFSELIRWQRERRSQDLPKPPAAPIPVVAPDVASLQSYTADFLRAESQTPAITWVGHATMLVQAGGLNVLTDPMFSHRASPIQLIGPTRAQPPGLALVDVPPIDVVVISHNHYDHLDTQSVLEVAQRSDARGVQTLFLVPLGVKSWFVNLGLTHVVELDWWDQYTLRGVTFDFTPVQHWSARGLGDRSQTLWGGWVVKAPDLHWYFSGDTGYSKDFSDTQKRLLNSAPMQPARGLDLALIPIGAYQPRWFLAEQHVDPAEAVQIHLDLKAKRSVGIHWGTFAMSDESLDQPPKDLADAVRAQQLDIDAFNVMAIGETRRLARRPP